MPVHAGEPIQDAYEVIAGDGSLHVNGQRGLGELISDSEIPILSPTGG